MRNKIALNFLALDDDLSPMMESSIIVVGKLTVSKRTIKLNHPEMITKL